jgi:DNA invertase Pin-like site-specific DNA recombinase
MAKRKGTEQKGAGRQPASGRAVAYLRVSTAVQEQGLGLAAQRTAVAEYVAERGLRLLDVVTEAASGGVQDGEEFSWEHRPRLLELLDRAGKGEYDVLLVARLDRLSRDYPTLAVLERRLQKLGVRVVSTAEDNGDGPMAEFIKGQVALVAQLERAIIRERLGKGKAEARKLGRRTEGSIPYGYRHRAAGRRSTELEPDPERAEIVRRIFRAAAAGDSLGSIAAGLDADGIPTSRGRSGWSREALRLILRSRFYLGANHGVRDAHPAIVDRRTWNRAQRALDARSRSN